MGLGVIRARSGRWRLQVGLLLGYGRLHGEGGSEGILRSETGWKFLGPSSIGLSVICIAKTGIRAPLAAYALGI